MIRLANKSDFIFISDLVEEMNARELQSKAQFNWDRSKITDELEKAETLVFDEEGIKSFLCYRTTQDFFEVTVLATSPENRRQGYQSHLVTHLQGLSLENKKPIFLEVHEENFSAVSFYQGLGFRFVSYRKNYYSDGKSAAVFAYN
jgi:ribosomal protein S18 acetylase RimI-like enzyme